MSFYNKTKNPFPFYPLEGEVWTNIKPLWHRTNCKVCCYSHKIGIGDYFFQLPISPSINSVDEVAAVDLRNVSDNQVVGDTNIDYEIYVDADSKKYLMITLTTDVGLINSDYYLGVITDLGNYYSEVFCVVNSLAKFITIEWASSKGKVGHLLYNEGFRHSINIETIILPTESEIEEESESDGFGNEIATLQILKQGHTMSFVVPNFIAQSLSALPLHDMVNFVNRAYGEQPVELEKKNKYITVRSTPEEDGCNALVEINYIDELIINTTCVAPTINLTSLAIPLWWIDSSTAEDRECVLPCVMTTVFGINEDQIPLVAFFERQMSSDFGDNWLTFPINEPQWAQNIVTPGVYWQRIRYVHVNGFVFYTNILQLTVS